MSTDKPAETTTDGESVYREAPGGWNLGPGRIIIPPERRELARARHSTSVEPSASVGDRRGRFPWGVALIFFVIVLAAGAAVAYALDHLGLV